MSKLDTTISPIRSPEWQNRLDFIVGMMKDMSSQTDPQAMVATYGQYMNKVLPIDRSVALSRRDLPHPQVRVTRSDTWTEDVNPWRQHNRLPLLDGGLLSELIYKDEPTIIDDLKVSPSDPGYEYLKGMGSLLALPLYDNGHALNMVLSMREGTHAFEHDVLPQQVWTSNLFGRATHNLVLRDEVRLAYDAVDHELRTVAEIQHDLLPHQLPELATMDLAAHYVTSKWAGGDYYDFFRTGPHETGILLADVSGHGTPAAVFMAVTHSLAHAAAEPSNPAAFLQRINEQLCKQYTRDSGRFVTAFYGVYNDLTRTLTYANAGHGPPRWRKRDGTVAEVDGNRSLPLGIDFEEVYPVAQAKFSPGDTIILYTDGVTETRDKTDELFGTARLDAAICPCENATADQTIGAILAKVDQFKGDVMQVDDVTLLVAKIR